MRKMMRAAAALCTVPMISMSLISVTGLTLSAQTDDVEANGWVQFRGPNGSGVASDSMSAPTEWSADKNLKWKVDLPGMGASSPIILGDKLYLTTYTGYGLDKESPGNVSELKRHLICFDREDGSEVWRATVDSDHDEELYEGFINVHGYASSTPVTDGSHIFAFFGKTGVVAFDLNGKEIWKTNVGTQTDPAKWGGGSSCVLVGNVLIVNAGNEGRAVIGLNKADGKERWRLEDENFANSWSTPSVIELEDRTEVVFNMPGKILAINPENGKEIWHAKSPVERTTCPSLAVEGDVVFAMGGRGGKGIAVRCGGEGDVTSSHVVWEASLKAGIGTPIVVDGMLFWTTGGITYCVDAKTGEEIYRSRLKKSADGDQASTGRPVGDYASPIVVGNHVYLTSRNGNVSVLEVAKEFNQVALNSFPDDVSAFNATPAVADGRLYIRSDQSLYCVGN